MQQSRIESHTQSEPRSKHEKPASAGRQDHRWCKGVTESEYMSTKQCCQSNLQCYLSIKQTHIRCSFPSSCTIYPLIIYVSLGSQQRYTAQLLFWISVVKGQFSLKTLITLNLAIGNKRDNSYWKVRRNTNLKRGQEGGRQFYKFKSETWMNETNNLTRVLQLYS